MKQTILIGLHLRSGSSIFRLDFDPQLADSDQITNFLKKKKIDNLVFQVTKSYERSPLTKTFIPKYDLIESDKSFLDICSEV